MRRIVFLLVFCVALSCGNKAQPLYDALRQIGQENQLVGMSVVVVKDGETAAAYHYGLADRSRQLPVTAQTHYRVASISKAVTAVALMHLYDQGKFGLDEDVSAYLGFALRNPAHAQQKITFRMLLSHTSGLRDGSGYGNFLAASYQAAGPPDIGRLLTPEGNYFSSDMWAGHGPGTYFQYANINFGVVATLVEALSGQRFDRYVDQHVLAPLGIAGSFNVAALEDINQLAVLYRNGVPQTDNFQGEAPDAPDLSGYGPGTNGLVFSPQGGLRVSAEDLAKFLLMLDGNGTYKGTKILEASTVEKLLSPQWTYDGSNGNNYHGLFNQWSLGFHLTTNTYNEDVVIPGKTFAGHPGEAYGLISDMYLERGTGFGLIFLTNGYTGAAGYEVGHRSAFYGPEEQVFDAVAEYGATATLLRKPPKAPLFVYDSASHSLRFPPRLQGELVRLLGSNGQEVFAGKLRHNPLPLPRIPEGYYIIQINDKQKPHTQKIIIR